MTDKEIFLYPRPIKAEPLFAVTWAFPNTYEVGMASLGYQLVWWLLESDRDLLVHRHFTNRQESGWAQSELLGFTVSWELDYINVLRTLEQASVSALAQERANDEPLVFGGGPVLSANPEPFADFFDVVLLGDAEVMVPKFLEAWKQVRSLKTRKEKLIALAQIDGLYVPSLYTYRIDSATGDVVSVEPTDGAVPATRTKQLFQAPPDYVAHSLILAPDTAFADMFLVEIARSCPQECRFCLASYLTRPFRAGNVETILNKIDLGLQHTRKIGLLGPSVTEHPQFDRIAEALLERPQTKVSIASIRADTIDPLVLKMLVSLGQKSVTIALESGSERLRAIMKKNLTEQQIKSAVGLIAESGLEALKFYGIVGLPGETQEDLEETVRLLTELKKTHRKLRLSFGVTSFVPKAQTPFQWAGRSKDSKRKLEYVKKHLSRVGIDVRPESHNWSDIQALLSRGDRRLTPMLLTVKGGDANLGAWRNSFRNLPPGCPDLDYFAYRDIPYEAVLPWSHLVDEAKTGMLERHNRAAQEIAISST